MIAGPSSILRVIGWFFTSAIGVAGIAIQLDLRGVTSAIETSLDTLGTIGEIVKAFLPLLGIALIAGGIAGALALGGPVLYRTLQSIARYRQDRRNEGPARRQLQDLARRMESCLRDLEYLEDLPWFDSQETGWSRVQLQANLHRLRIDLASLGVDTPETEEVEKINWTYWRWLLISLIDCAKAGDIERARLVHPTNAGRMGMRSEATES